MHNNYVNIWTFWLTALWKERTCHRIFCFCKTATEISNTFNRCSFSLQFSSSFTLVDIFIHLFLCTAKTIHSEWITVFGTTLSRIKYVLELPLKYCFFLQAFKVLVSHLQSVLLYYVAPSVHLSVHLASKFCHS